jgi:RNA polymerase sigma-70 factor (sigma-E family)
VGVADDGFTEFAQACQTRLIRYADLLCGDRGRAEDLVQHALVKVYLAWSRLRDGNPEAYARTVVTRAHVDWWRRKASLEAVTDTVAERAADEDFVAALTRRDAVMRALSALTARERAVMVLKYLYDLPEAAVAAEIGCSVGTVKSAGSRALAKLRTSELTTEDVAP